MSKKILCIICSLIISLSIFVIPSFADTSFPVLPVGSFSSFSSDLLYVGDLASNVQVGYYSTSNYPVYAFYAPQELNSSNFAVFFFSEDIIVPNSSSSYKIRGIQSNGNYYLYPTYSYLASDSDYYLHCAKAKFTILNNDFVNGIPVFFSLDDAINAVTNFINNDTSSDIISYTTHVSLEPGTVLYIGYNPNIDLNITGTTRFPMRSSFIGGNFPDSSQTFSFASSLPQSGTSFPLPNAQKLPWIKDEPYNILGQSFNAKLGNFVLASSSQGFYAIHNPYFVNVENFNASGDLNTNSTLELDISGYTSLRIYPLQDEILNSSSPDDFNIYWEGSSTDNGDGTGTVSWTPTAVDGSDVSNIGSNPNNLGINGGGNLDSSSIIQDIKNTLDRFVENFISFVSAPISHIQQLISAGSGFMSALQGMYAWLPAQIQGYLISALTIIIAIGVFKVFL